MPRYNRGLALQSQGRLAAARMCFREALELNPGLVILDVSMPVLDGLSAAEKIRAALPNVPVLMFTADPSPDLSQIAQSVGAQGIVRKTDLSEVLLRAVDALLAGQTFFP